MQRHNFFGPRPLGSWGGANRPNIIKSQLQSQFQIFVNQTVCVFSQRKEWERSDAVVECFTRDRRAAGSSLTGVTALWSLSKTHLS